MDFSFSPRSVELQREMVEFLNDHVHPAEATFHSQVAVGEPHAQPAILEELKSLARQRGLWNLFLPHETPWHEAMSNVDYAPIAELSGRSIPLAPEAMNCNPPDTGNMELLTMFGGDEQKDRWLRPLLAGTIRSSYVMTEPGTASSDASNIATSIERHGDEYIINGRKWWITGAARERCELLLVMGVTNPDADRHRRHSIILVPKNTPGVTIGRDLHLLGYEPWESHVEMDFVDVRVPASALLGSEGAGFAMAQARLGPGRIHHCMRQIGAAERALSLMVERAQSRVAFGAPIADQGVIRDLIAHSRIELDQARLYTLHTAWLMDNYGNKHAAGQISGIKVVVPRVATTVIDRAIQVFGAAGLSQDTPLSYMYADARTMRLADGPDEVHVRAVARNELRRQEAARGDREPLQLLRY